MAVHLEHSLDYSGSAAAAAVLRVFWHDQEAHVLSTDHVSLWVWLGRGEGGRRVCIDGVGASF